MSTRRPILIALIALAVALLPVAGGMAVATPHAAFTAPQADCCPNGKPCEKKTNGCGSVSGCALKCFSLTGAIGCTGRRLADGFELWRSMCSRSGRVSLSGGASPPTSSSLLNSSLTMRRFAGWPRERAVARALSRTSCMKKFRRGDMRRVSSLTSLALSASLVVAFTYWYGGSQARTPAHNPRSLPPQARSESPRRNRGERFCTTATPWARPTRRRCRRRTRWGWTTSPSTRARRMTPAPSR